ncbi:MAG: glycerol-3-phosphate 1-O-acyltransferase PlsY [Deltaproteobacteria bacterium]|nr:glycerol-3-phosphate 1-O-acyltransferase PlsY [Deltaproteobacteria bacterium]
MSELPPLLASVVVLAYLMGSVPFGLLIARTFAKVDVREQGSGNIGATNVARTVGKGLGALTLLLDATKGLVPVLVASALVEGRTAQPTLWIAITGLAAFLGHCFPLYLKFKGGKGVATALGVFLGTAPLAALAGAAVWGMVYGVFRISSIGSLLAALLVPTLIWFFYDHTTFWLAVLITVVVIAKHHGNIRRIIQRVEEKA